MPTYKVVNKVTGEVVYAYTADAPVEWFGMEFDTHEHTTKIVVTPPPRRRVSRLDFVQLLGPRATGILAAAKVSVDVELFVRMLEWATPERDGTSIDLDDPRLAVALARLEAAGLLLAGDAAKVLSGDGI